MAKNAKKENMCGPVSYQNWLAFEKIPAANRTAPIPIQSTSTGNAGHRIGLISPHMVEVPLFTDIDELTGEIATGLGPYRLINARAVGAPGDVPRIFLRASWNPSLSAGGTKRGEIKTSADFHHGGDLYDEIAALVSLAGGIRVMAGPPTRLFSPGGDPLGTPQYTDDERNLRPFRRAGRPVIPRYPKTFCINDSEQRLATLPRLSARRASELLVAARCYQQALWHSEADPQFAWLLFVSAVESAANFHYESVDPITALREGMPDLYKLIEKRAADDDNKTWIEKVAGQLKGLTGATKKFVNFFAEFWPDAPGWATTETRERFEYPWRQRKGESKEEWRRGIEVDLRKVYSWRSKALHGGTAFPPPMLNAPIPIGEKYEERPAVLATMMGDSSWSAADMPMLLHVFEHLVRGALLKWWGSMVPPTAPEVAPNSTA